MRSLVGANEAGLPLPGIMRKGHAPAEGRTDEIRSWRMSAIGYHASESRNHGIDFEAIVGFGERVQRGCVDIEGPRGLRWWLPAGAGGATARGKQRAPAARAALNRLAERTGVYARCATSTPASSNSPEISAPVDCGDHRHAARSRSEIPQAGEQVVPKSRREAPSGKE